MWPDDRLAASDVPTFSRRALSDRPEALFPHRPLCRGRGHTPSATGPARRRGADSWSRSLESYPSCALPPLSSWQAKREPRVSRRRSSPTSLTSGGASEGWKRWKPRSWSGVEAFCRPVRALVGCGQACPCHLPCHQHGIRVLKRSPRRSPIPAKGPPGGAPTGPGAGSAGARGASRCRAAGIVEEAPLVVPRLVEHLAPLGHAVQVHAQRKVERAVVAVGWPVRADYAPPPAPTG